MNTKLKLALFFAFITSIIFANNHSDSKTFNVLSPFYNNSIRGKVSIKNDTIPPKTSAELKYEKYIKDTKDYNKEIDSLKKSLEEKNVSNGKLRNRRLNSAKFAFKKTFDNSRQIMNEKRKSEISDNKLVHKINVDERRRLQLEQLAANRLKKRRVIPVQVVNEREKDSSNNFKGRKNPLEKNKRFVVKNKSKKLIREVDDNQTTENDNQHVKNNNVSIANIETNQKQYESESVKSLPRKELNIPVDNFENQEHAKLDEIKSENIIENKEENKDVESKTFIVANENQNKNTSTIELNKENSLTIPVQKTIKDSSLLNNEPIKTKVSETLKSVEKPTNASVVGTTKPIDKPTITNSTKVEEKKKNVSEFVFDREENFEYASVEEMLIRIDALEKIKSKFDEQHSYFLVRTASDLEDESMEKHKKIESKQDVSDLVNVINMLDKIEEMEIAKMKMDYNLAYLRAREEFMKNPEKFKEKLLASAEKENLDADELLRIIKHLENTKTKIENNHAYFLSRIIEEIDKDLK